MAGPIKQRDERAAARTAAARATRMRASAELAVNDPVALNRAARIVRAALARQALTEADLRGPVVNPADLRGGPDAA